MTILITYALNDRRVPWWGLLLALLVLVVVDVLWYRPPEKKLDKGIEIRDEI